MEAAPGVTDNVKREEVEAAQGEVKPVTSQPIDMEDVPDPDEDDLDDLDDMLEEFSAAKIGPSDTIKAASPPAPSQPESSSKAPAAESQPNPGEEFSEDEFAKQLQAGMANLLGELEKSPEMQAEFEVMFKQMSEAVAAEQKPSESTTPAADSSTPGTTKAAANSAEEQKPSESTTPAADSSTPGTTKAAANSADEGLSFQETIRRTMERMQSSGEQATAAAAAGGEDDFMAEMLKQLTSGDLGGAGNDEDFSKMLMGMMEQLTNKEILYEPMKELHDKFPEWLAKNKNTVPAEDLKRYEEQKTIVAEIVAKFDEPTYTDSNAADREYIVDRMQKMQAAGSPPSDLVGDMASAQDAFSAADEQCNPQ